MTNTCKLRAQTCTEAASSVCQWWDRQCILCAGMICPHIVNVSMMLGAILSWGILWPYIDGKAGDWFPVGLKEHDFKGLFGYQVTSPHPA